MADTFVESLRKVHKRFQELSTFRATKAVWGNAPFANSAICHPGDTIIVKVWHCQKGPTVIDVKRADYNFTKDGQTCVPFEWVMEMGADPDLWMYMPWLGKSWEEIIKWNEENPLEKTTLEKHLEAFEDWALGKEFTTKARKKAGKR